MSSRRCSLLLLTLLSAAAPAAELVINEIHYDPGDNTLKTEFIEIWNPGQEGIDLSGWSLARAVNFTFPNGTQLAAGGFLVIAEDPDAIFAKYAVVAKGPYVGKLSNEGERLELYEGSGALRDEVGYQAKFPWPVGSAGEGKSMSLINPSLDNDLGGSWRAADPTPGATNAGYSALAPPAIRQVNHTPIQPKSNEPIVLTAKVTDPEGVASVKVLYQIVRPGNFLPSEFPLTHNQLLATPTLARTPNPAFENATNWTEVSMADDGSGSDAIAGDAIFTGTIPGQASRTLVRYRIVAEDANTPSASVRVPYADDPSLNFACFVYDGVPPYVPTDRTVRPEGLGYIYSTNVMTSLPVYMLITRAPDLTECIAYDSSLQIPRTNTMARDCFNWEGAFVYDGEVYDHVHYRLRGYNQRYQLRNKRNMRFRFNAGNYLKARDQKGRPYPTEWRTLNTCKMFGPRDDGNYGLAETMNYLLYNLVGVPAPFAHTFHFRVVDGVEESPMGPGGQYNGDFWGMALALEDYDSRFLEAHGMDKGNLYKLKDGEKRAYEEERYQAPDAVSHGEDYTNIVANLHHTKSETWLRTYVDYDQWYLYETVQQAIRHYDLGMYPEQENRTAPVDTDAGKNLAWYFKPTTGSDLGKLWHLPWDTEQTWGPNGAHQGWDMALVAMIDPTVTDGRAALNYTGGVNVKTNLYLGYRNTLREFRDLIWNPETLNPMIDRFAAVIADFVAADRDRWKDHPLTGTAKSDFGSLEDIVTDMKAFAFVGGTHWPVADRPNTSMVAPGGRAMELENRANYGGDSNSIPNKPTVTAMHTNEFPIEDLFFTTSAFSDPQGAGTFGTLKWRVAEVTDPSAPAYDADADPLYEWKASWTSEEITTFSNEIRIPASAVAVGHAYRVRVRMKDNTERWGHWSDPVQFIPKLTAAIPPSITQSPADLDAYLGQTPLFTAHATGNPAPGYQWLFNDAPLANQTNAQLSLSLTQTNQAGTYSVVVTNRAGTNSVSFTLNITAKPALVITEVLSSESLGTINSTLNHRDWWELSNLGNFPVNLRGFRFDDNHGLLTHAETLTNHVHILPGESIVLVEDMSPAQFRLWWGANNLPAGLQILTYPNIGFSATGDAIYLWNAAATADADLITHVTFAAATRGVSFGFNPDTKIFGALSVVGENGAFAAAVNGDVGSPGTIVNRPRFTQTEFSAATGFGCTFITQPNRDYVIQYKDDLTTASWSVLTNFMATSNSFTFTDRTATTNAARYYRIMLVP